MVSRAYYPSPHAHAHDGGARYAVSSRSCAAPYISYSERRYHLPSHDARAITMNDAQGGDESAAAPRKRIAVACGRCRKRKIRCSGDPGGGMQCTNCKNAGVDQCLFLRVQSQEAPMRDDNRYEYNMDVSRTLAQRGAGSVAHMGASLSPYPADMGLLSSGAMTTTAAAAYRGSGAYQSVGTKGYYPMAAEWSDAYGADAGVDYAMACPQYPLLNHDPVHMVSGYGHWPAAARQKSAAPTPASVYMDSDSGYAYGTAAAAAPASSTTAPANATLVHRPAVSGDSSAYSFSTIAASLPSAASEQRLLPTPVSRSLTSSYRTDACLGGGGGGGGPYVGLATTTAAKASIPPDTTTTTPPSPVADVVVTAGYASSAYEYARGAATAAADAYTNNTNNHTNHGAGTSESIFGDADRSAASQGSAVGDLGVYTYGGAADDDDDDGGEAAGLRRASAGSGLTARSTGSSTSSNTSSSYGSGSSDGAAYHHHQHHHQHHQQQQHPHPHASSTTPSSSSSHGHGHHHHHQHQHHHHQQHTAARGHHGGHHVVQQHSVPGGTTAVAAAAYAEGSSGNNNTTTTNAGHGGVVIGGVGGIGGGGTAAAADSHHHHRASVASRR